MVMELYWGIAVAVLGLLVGSFAGAQVWRLRRHQLLEEKLAGEPYSKRELKKLDVLKPVAGKADRSHCLHCGHVLAWYDLVPLLSWLSTRGRCRYCKKPIGSFEPIIELVTMAVFVMSYVWWPYQFNDAGGLMLFVLWLGALIPGAILFAYDYKWSLLPDSANYALIVLGAMFAATALYAGETTPLQLFGALAVLAGLYAGLYYFSRWRYGEDATWVGFGDVKLSLALALFALNWQIAFVIVFLANLLGTLLVLPGIIRGAVGRRAHIPFGPLLLCATVIGALFGEVILEWYFQLFLLSP